MHFVLFNIGNIPVHGYGLMIGIGIIAAFIVLELRAKQLKINSNIALRLTRNIDPTRFFLINLSILPPHFWRHSYYLFPATGGLTRVIISSSISRALTPST